MSDLAISYRDIAELKPNPNNPRTHSPRQIQQIARSLELFGFVEPAVIGPDGLIVCGHGRIAACALVGIKRVPTVELRHLSAEQRRAYAIAANQLATLAGWDQDLLRIELSELEALDAGIELIDLGFETAELDLMLRGERNPEEPDPADELAVPTGPPVTQPGDLWLLAGHRLHCADATRPESYSILMDGALAQLCISDPPYNLGIRHISKGDFGEFINASGEMSPAEFVRFLSGGFRLIAQHTADGALVYIFMGRQTLMEFLRAGRIVFGDPKDICIWTKESGGFGGLYRSAYEPIGVFKSGSGSSIDNVQLGRFGRNRTNVWPFARRADWQGRRDDLASAHPTPKPIPLLISAIEDASHRGGIVLDPFMGAASTMIAADRVGRRCYGLELDPRYVDLSLRRVKAATGIVPIHAATGLTFDEQEERAAAAFVPSPIMGDDHGQANRPG